MKKITTLLFLLFFGIITAQVQIGQTIVAATENDGTGSNVAISGNGNRMVFGSNLAAANGNDFTGIVRVYELDGGQWLQLGQTLTGTIPFEYFGTEVDIATDGNTIAVSNDFEARMYGFDGNSWVQIGNPVSVPDIFLMANIRLSANGEVLSACYSLESGSTSPVVQIYKKVNNQWVEMGSGFYDENTCVNAMSDDGMKILLSNFDTILSIKVYEFLNNDWVQIGNSINDEGDATLSGNGLRQVLVKNNPSNDEVRTYDYDGTNWVETLPMFILPANGSSTNSISISSNGKQFIVGTSVNNPNGNDESYMGVYQEEGGNWLQIVYDPSISSYYENVSGNVDITADGRKIAVGSLFVAPGDERGNIKNFNISALLSNNSQNAIPISVFPNPTSGTFSIDLGKDFSEINTTIFNMLGQVIASEKFANTNSIQLQIKGAAGIYFVNLTTSEGLSETIKIIKN